MKNYFLFICMLTAMLLFGCASVPSPGFDISVSNGHVDEFEITVEPVWLEDSFRFLTVRYGPGIGVFLVKFDNRSSEPIKILWEGIFDHIRLFIVYAFFTGTKIYKCGGPCLSNDYSK